MWVEIRSRPSYPLPHLIPAESESDRSAPKIVFKRGTIVHRREVLKLPTGSGETMNTEAR